MATEKKTKKTEVKKTEGVSAKAESAKQNVEQKKSDEVKALDAAKQQKEKAAKQPSGIVTSAGNVIRHAHVEFLSKLGIAIVAGAMYGKLVSGKKGDAAEANLKALPNHALSKEDYVTFQRMAKDNPKNALAFAVEKAYPYHVKDKEFANGVGQVNGQDVNYAYVRPVTKENAGEQYANLEGKFQMVSGLKGEDGKHSNVSVVTMDARELAMYRHRADVELNDKGKVVKVGAPVTILQIAEIGVQRQLAEREARNALLTEAKGIDWGKYGIPPGAKVSIQLGDSNQNDRVWANATVNGVKAKGVLLSPVETLAFREKIATLPQVLMHNDFARKQVFDINKANYQDLKANSETYAMNAILRRTADTDPRAQFTKEEVDIITIHLGKSEERDAAVAQLIEKAEVSVKEKGLEPDWFEPVKDELKDIAAGQWQQKAESASMGV